jgi:hypothetical protein
LACTLFGYTCNHFVYGRSDPRINVTKLIPVLFMQWQRNLRPLRNDQMEMNPLGWLAFWPFFPRFGSHGPSTSLCHFLASLMRASNYSLLSRFSHNCSLIYPRAKFGAWSVSHPLYCPVSGAG